MTSHSLATLAVAGLIVLAGCAGVTQDSPEPATDGSIAASNAGTVSFYVSDRPNAIGDFEHLNVTITSVGFRSVDADEESPEAEAESEDEDREHDEDDDETWLERQVSNRTVDLTELRGANASLVDRFDLPEGTYGTVFVNVGDINATLEDGGRVHVKLPSEKLQIHEQFDVTNGSEVDFVFDIAVHKAGRSGKYILSPVISESGTDVPFDRTDTDDADLDDDEADQDHGVDAVIKGPVRAGGSATVEVTDRGSPVENATVYVNDDRAGRTDRDGRLRIAVPEGDELELTIEYGDVEIERERELQPDDDTPDST